MKFRKRILAMLLLSVILLLLCGCVAKEKTAAPEQPSAQTGYSSPEDLAGKKIGVVTGTICDQVVEKHIPDVKIEYYNATPDLPVALDSGKIDGYIVDQPIMRVLVAENPTQRCLGTVEDDQYGYIFPKTERGVALRDQFNEFLAKIKADGTLAEIDALWFGDDETKKVVDVDSLTGENGTLGFSASFTMTPFAYIKDGKMVGYEFDIAVRFCREYGYALNISDTTFAGVVASVTSGKSDFGAAGISITEERKESMYFSDPDYIGGMVLVVKGGDSSASEQPSAQTVYSSLEDLAGKKIGVLTGSIFDKVAQEKIPGIQPEYLNAMSDMPVALQADKIDAYLIDEPIFRNISRNYPEEYIIDQLTYEDYAFLFPKNSERHEKICAELNEFLAESWENGTMQEISDKWITGDTETARIDFTGLTGENGTLKMAVSSELGMPFTFMKNNEFAGYDIEVIVRFCRDRGYALELSDYSISGMLTATSAGKADIAGGCVSITEERKESILFSEPDYHGGIVLIGTKGVAEEDSASGIAESFTKTFLRESRWKLFVNGIGVTLLITLLSTVFGTALGFGIYMLYRKNYKPFNVAVNLLMDILEKTPVVVILMILYYIAFGKSNLKGVWVSVIGFSIMFACTFVGTLKIGVMAVDRGQTEASLALGFTDRRSFLRVIFPQAAKHFLPNYKGQIVSLLKDTAVVGYIAVQDLTKVGDIVRSRTYEAFFPLVATAVIYFLLAWLLTRLVQCIEFRTDPTRRSREKILKGVETK